MSNLHIGRSDWERSLNVRRDCKASVFVDLGYVFSFLPAAPRTAHYSDLHFSSARVLAFTNAQRGHPGGPLSTAGMGSGPYQKTHYHYIKPARVQVLNSGPSMPFQICIHGNKFSIGPLIFASSYRLEGIYTSSSLPLPRKTKTQHIFVPRQATLQGLCISDTIPVVPQMYRSRKWN